MELKRLATTFVSSGELRGRMFTNNVHKGQYMRISNRQNAVRKPTGVPILFRSGKMFFINNFFPYWNIISFPRSRAESLDETTGAL